MCMILTQLKHKQVEFSRYYTILLLCNATILLFVVTEILLNCIIDLN